MINAAGEMYAGFTRYGKMIAVNDQTGEQWGLPLNLELFVACALGSAFEFGIIRIQSKKPPNQPKADRSGRYSSPTLQR